MKMNLNNKDIVLKAKDKLIKKVEKLGKPIKLMEFCGGHTHAIMRYAIDKLLDGYIEFIHGPGCPVCVASMDRIDLAIELAKMPNVIFTTYGDLLRVPGSYRKSLLDIRSEGHNVRSLYSCLDAIDIAVKNQDKNVIFFAIGFETTTPPTAVLLKKAKEMKLKNLFVVSNHVMTPPAIGYILNAGISHIDGIIGPGHVSVITGMKIYKELDIPIVISGFEAFDILKAVNMILDQHIKHERKVENAYTRAVTEEGNKEAQKLIEQTLDIRDTFNWRGIGPLPKSALKINKDYEMFDAEKAFDVKLPPSKEHPLCICPKVIVGKAKPTDCKLFGNLCTPENPIGSCMVSSEGACAAYYKYQEVELCM